MAFQKLRARLNQKQAERVFLEAQRALLTPQRTNPAAVGMFVVSILILLIPVAILGFGVWLIVAFWFSIVPFLIGLVFVALSYFLCPRWPKNTAKTFRRNEMPELFHLLDEISGALGTSPPDGIHLFDDVNAYAASFGVRRTERILGIGIPMWRSQTPEERIAILAHEMAHFVNNDPARGVVTGMALYTVEGWEYFLAPGIYCDDYQRGWEEILAEVFLWIGRSPVTLLGTILLLLQFNRSQRAEYLADGLAAAVSGTSAMVTSLAKLNLTPLAFTAIELLYPYRKNQNGQVFDVMSQAILNASVDDRTKMDQEAADTKARVDDTHPPTVYRIGFLEALGELPPKINAADFDFDKMDAELAAESDRLGKRLMQQYEDTTM